MRDANIIRVLKTFTKKEIDEFETYVNSPAQLKKRDVRKIFNSLKEFYPDFEGKSLNDEHLFKSIFPNEKFVKKKLTLSVFHLYDSVCDFLVLSGTNEKEPDRTFALMEELLKRGMENSFRKLARKLDKKLVSTEY